MQRLFPENFFVEPVKGSSLRVGVGEFPTEDDSEAGTPFAGGHGNWLNVLYRNAGVQRKDVSLLNVIQCKPPANSFPTDSKARAFISDSEAHKAIQHCLQAHTIPFLESRPWERVDLFGEAPLKWIAQKHGGIERWRGSPLEIPALGSAVKTVPTYAPSTLGANQNMVPVVINDLRKPLEKEPEHYNIFPSLENVKKFRAKKFAFDLETNRWKSDEIYMVGLSAGPHEAIVVPFTEAYRGELKRIFAEAEEVIGQNLIQFDLPILEHNGITIPPPAKCKVWDIMLMHHLRFPTFPHDLEFIGKQFTNKGAWKYDKVSFETYCARDVDVTFRVFEPLKELLEQADVLDIYRYISWPLGMICRLMREWGFKRSTSRLKELRVKYLEDIAREQKNLPPHLQTFFEKKRKRLPAPEGTVNEKGKPLKFVYEVYEEAKHPWKSSKVKLDFLYNECSLPEQLHFKTKKPTVDKIALDRLFNRLNNPSQELLKRFGAERIAELRTWVKTLRDLNQWSTRLSGFAKDSDIPDEFMHPHFNVHGTETGRFSSSEPNAQNIPEEARFMYIPRSPDGRIISIDYSGIENRLVAFMANDRRRLRWFEDPQFSEHTYLASILEGVSYKEVVKSKDKDSWYAIAKAIVHGADRMRGAKNIWEKNDLDPERVKRVLFTWKNQIADTVAWQRRVADEVRRVGWACNPFKRKLWFWESNAATRVVSFYPQSTAFDVLARAMIGLMYERINWPREWAEKVCPVCIPLPKGTNLNLQVHDELVVETESEALVAPTIETMKTVMTQPWKELNGLSLPVGIGFGRSWGECS